MTPSARVQFSLSPPGRLFDLGLGLLTILLLTISPLALEGLGWQYDESGGSAIEKLHPATFLASLLVLAAAARRRNPLSMFAASAAAYPGLVVFVAANVLLIAHAILVAHLPFTMFFDTFLLPAMLFLLLADVGERRGRPLALMVHALLVANSLLGIAEFLFGFRLTPLIIQGIDLEEWRSSALLGHPLGNALLTGSYLVLLATGGARDLPALLRPFAFLVCAAGMVVFGGRVATAFVVLSLVFLGAKRLLAVLAGAQFNPASVLTGLIVVPFGGLMIAGLSDAGFFDQFISRLSDDDGSAITRVNMFELFHYISWQDLLFGPDQSQIDTLKVHYGLEFGIESFWISMIFSHGLIASFAFFIGLFCFCREVVRATAPGGLAAFIYFFAVSSTSLSLSAKTPAFGVLVLMVMLLARPAPPMLAARRH
jgi:hypothetical protein